MSSNVPAKLKAADINRFALRAAQLEKVKPAIAYWCYYWITNQILSKGLHQSDDECMQYTTNMVDKLEEMKTQHSSDDAITDDVAGQAYVEQFGLDTFQRADNAVRANKASRQTADTFQAAATFLDLVHIWGPPSSDIASKIKYAKFHALRIAKALKAGEDPNESNPELAPVPNEDALVKLDPADPEVRDIMDTYQQPSVEAAPEDGMPAPSRSAGLTDIPEEGPTTTASSWNAASLPRPVDEAPPPDFTDQKQPTPFKDSPSTANPRQNSLGGGYFPELSTPSAPSGDDFLPSAASHDPDIVVPPSAPESDPRSFYSTSDITATIAAPPVAPPSSIPPPTQPQAQTRPHQPPAALSRQVPPPIVSPMTNGAVELDDAAMADAQKHARWAISALNFEDVPTAIKELRTALRVLGGE